MWGDIELGAKSPGFFIDLFLYSELIVENTHVGEIRIILTDFLGTAVVFEVIQCVKDPRNFSTRGG